MIKFCIHCGKEFEGQGDLCQECLEKAAKPVVQVSLNDKIQSFTNNLKELAASARNVPKAFYIMMAAVLCLVIAGIVGINYYHKHSRSAYHRYASVIATSVENSANVIHNHKNVVIDSTGSVLFSDSKYQMRKKNDFSFADEVNKIKTDNEIAEKYQWAVHIADDGTVDAAYCADTFESEKMGVYGKNADRSYATIGEYMAAQKELEEQAMKNYDELDSANNKALEIGSFVKGSFFPDGIDARAVFCNFDEKYDSGNSELNEMLADKFDGYWIISCIVSSDNSTAENACDVYWAEDLSTAVVGKSEHGTISNIEENGDYDVDGGIKSLLNKEETECSLISTAEWEKKNGTAFIQKRKEIEKQEQEQREEEEMKKNSLGKLDDIVDQYNKKLSLILNDKLQYKDEEKQKTGVIVHKYTYASGVVHVQIAERNGYVVDISVAVGVSLTDALNEAETSTGWTGIVVTTYFPLSFLENYSTKEEILSKFGDENNYRDKTNIYTIDGSSYTAKLYEIAGVTSVVFTPR